MSALEGNTTFDRTARLRITSMALVGVAMEIGIEPTASHAADLAHSRRRGGRLRQRTCRRGATLRRIAEFAGDAIFTDVERSARR